jgi:YjbE family integral membrane protein
VSAAGEPAGRAAPDSWRWTIFAELTGLFSMAELTALVSVIVIDLVLAGDNAIVVGMAAAGLPRELRKKAIIIGIAAAAVLRIIFALFTTQLLNVIGLVLAGGLLLLWVAWKLFRETRRAAQEAHDLHALTYPERPAGPHSLSASAAIAAKPKKTFASALSQIVVADISMSLDNVLAVAGTARHHQVVLVIGLAVSVALMGVAASLVAGVLRRFPWISYVGLMLIAWVACTMIYEGASEVFRVAGHNLGPPA